MYVHTEIELMTTGIANNSSIYIQNYIKIQDIERRSTFISRSLGSWASSKRTVNHVHDLLWVVWTILIDGHSAVQLIGIDHHNVVQLTRIYWYYFCQKARMDLWKVINLTQIISQHLDKLCRVDQHNFVRLSPKRENWKELLLEPWRWTAEPPRIYLSNVAKHSLIKNNDAQHTPCH